VCYIRTYLEETIGLAEAGVAVICEHTVHTYVNGRYVLGCDREAQAAAVAAHGTKPYIKAIQCKAKIPTGLNLLTGTER